MNRAQVSLMIGDDKLYNEFVKPLSSERRLMPLIVKLLGSYYYNSDVQQLVDGVSLSSLKEQQDSESDENKRLREKLQDIRASVQFFGMCINETNATLEEGMDMVNSFARVTGGTVHDTSESRSNVPRLSMKGIDEIHDKVNHSGDGDTIRVEDPRFDLLKKDVEDVKSSVDKILELIQGSSVSVVSVATSVANNSQIHGEETQVRMANPAVESVLTPVPLSNDVESEERTPEESEAGRSMLKGMLLGGGVGGFS